jgi:hypothetical protein
MSDSKENEKTSKMIFIWEAFLMFGKNSTSTFKVTSLQLEPSLRGTLYHTLPSLRGAYNNFQTLLQTSMRRGNLPLERQCSLFRHCEAHKTMIKFYNKHPCAVAISSLEPKSPLYLHCGAHKTISNVTRNIPAPWQSPH